MTSAQLGGPSAEWREVEAGEEGASLDRKNFLADAGAATLLLLPGIPGTRLEQAAAACIRGAEAAFRHVNIPRFGSHLRLLETKRGAAEGGAVRAAERMEARRSAAQVHLESQKLLKLKDRRIDELDRQAGRLRLDKKQIAGDFAALKSRLADMEK